MNFWAQKFQLKLKVGIFRKERKMTKFREFERGASLRKNIVHFRLKQTNAFPEIVGQVSRGIAIRFDTDTEAELQN